MSPQISVIVCTRNRPHPLARMLDRFLSQDFRVARSWELVVVDNGSDDAVGPMVEARARGAEGEVRTIVERRPGLSRARNAGLAVARGEVIAFTDDDVLVAPDWLDEIAREFAPGGQIDFLGGRLLLAGAGQQPVAAVTNDRRAVYRRPASDWFATGANMAFHRRVFERIGGFDVRLGAGAALRSAEDQDFSFRALRAGFTGLHAPNVCAYHDHDRKTPDQALALFYEYGFGAAAVYAKHALGLDRYGLKSIYWALHQIRRELPMARDDLRSSYLRGLRAGLLSSPWVLLTRSAQTG